MASCPRPKKRTGTGGTSASSFRKRNSSVDDFDTGAITAGCTKAATGEISSTSSVINSVMVSWLGSECSGRANTKWKNGWMGV